MLAHIRRFVYAMGYRPKPGTILYSPSWIHKDIMIKSCEALEQGHVNAMDVVGQDYLRYGFPARAQQPLLRREEGEGGAVADGKVNYGFLFNNAGDKVGVVAEWIY